MGWTTRNITELTEEVWYYLRGEEYSAQIDEFVRRIRNPGPSRACDFASALETDRAVAMINGLEMQADQPAKESKPLPALLRRLGFGGSNG